jgi:hypothetical protein
MQRSVLWRHEPPLLCLTVLQRWLQLLHGVADALVQVRVVPLADLDELRCNIATVPSDCPRSAVRSATGFKASIGGTGPRASMLLQRLCKPRFPHFT